MKLLIDTNVVLDFLLAREGAEAAKEIFKLAEEHSEYECVTASSVTDILYTLTKANKERNHQNESGKTNKEIETESARMLSDFLTIVHILPVTEHDVKTAFSLGWDDIEDALQYSVAVSNDVDVIITSNVKDFENSNIPVKRPGDFLNERNTNN